MLTEFIINCLKLEIIRIIRHGPLSILTQYSPELPDKEIISIILHTGDISCPEYNFRASRPPVSFDRAIDMRVLEWRYRSSWNILVQANTIILSPATHHPACIRTASPEFDLSIILIIYWSSVDLHINVRPLLHQDLIKIKYNSNLFNFQNLSDRVKCRV